MEAAHAFTSRRRLRLGALLLRSGLLSPEQLAEALEEKERTGDRIGEIVVRNGWVTEQAVAQTLADQCDVEFVDLDAQPPEARVESLLSAKVARYFRGVPVRFLDASTVLFAVSEPTAFSPDEVRQALGYDVRLAVATSSAIDEALSRLEQAQPHAAGAPAGPPAEPVPPPEGAAPVNRLVPGPPAVAGAEDQPEALEDEGTGAPADEAGEPEPLAQLRAVASPDPVPSLWKWQPAAAPEADLAEPAPELGPPPEAAPPPETTVPAGAPVTLWHRPAAPKPYVEPRAEAAPDAEATGEPAEPAPGKLGRVDVAATEPAPAQATPDPTADEAGPERVAEEPAVELEQEPALPPPGFGPELPVSPSTAPTAAESQPEIPLAGPQVAGTPAGSPGAPAAKAPAPPPWLPPADSPGLERVHLPAAPAEDAEPRHGTSLVPLFEERRPQLGTMLLRAGLITPSQLAEALEEKEETGERLGEILLRRGWLGEKSLARTLAEQHGLQFYDLSGAPPNAAVATLLPERFARRYRAIPVRFAAENTLLVAVADPTDVIASDDLRIALSETIELAVATPTEIQSALDRIFPSRQPEPEPDLPLEVETEGGQPPGTRRNETVDVMEASRSAPAVGLVNEVIRRAVQEGASDIHFEPQADRMLVRIRVDGVMQEMRIVPQTLQQAVVARLKVMSELDIAERRAPQDGRISIKFGGKPIDLRVAILPTVHGEQVVVRILYRGSNLATFADLGLDGGTREILTEAIQQPYGMVVSVGPTGSGKTTTLYAALAMLNTEDRCLMTVEDPVEYQIPGINQIQVNVKAGLSFAQGLRTILRSDPDVLLVGEIRDAETARIAVQAAMTGHLVLSTLHADNVGSAISRLADMGVERQLLASSINCLFAQRLARRLCPSCKEPYTLDPEVLRADGADKRLLPPGPATVYKACGCAHCFGGYKGRVGLFETLTVTPKMRRLFETATAEEIYEAAVSAGMRTLQDDGLRLVLEGVTSLEEIRRVAGSRRI
jgi:type IV pilus assembly protein PilB